MEEKISIIVPIYNMEQVLDRCISSILNQTYRNLEIILVNDGSVDRSLEICQKYAKEDSRIKIINQKNGGLSSARNSGLRVAAGDYIGFVDSDDYIADTMYEELLGLCRSEEADIAVCEYFRFSGDRIREFEQPQSYTRTMDKREALRELHGRRGELYTVVWNKLYRSALFEHISYPEGKINEDEFISYKVIDLSEKVAYTNQRLYFYYINQKSITSNKNYLQKSAIYEAYDERYDYFLQKGEVEIAELVHKAYLNRMIFRCKWIKDDRKMLKSKWLAYRKKYKEFDGKKYGIGYSVFYVSPKLYWFLVKTKEGKRA